MAERTRRLLLFGECTSFWGIAIQLEVFYLTHFFPMHSFSTPWEQKTSGFLMFSGGRERVHWEQMGWIEDGPGNPKKRIPLYIILSHVIFISFELELKPNFMNTPTQVCEATRRRQVILNYEKPPIISVPI